MATPFLRALRQHFPVAHVAALHNPLVATVLAGLPFVDRAVSYQRTAAGKIHGAATARELRREQFDLAILLPNSFRSAAIAWRAGIPRRLGYAREYRTPLLTDTIAPLRRSAAEQAQHMERLAAIRTIRRQLPPDAIPAAALPRRHLLRPYQPVPTTLYYLELARYLGADSSDFHMQLAVTPEEAAAADAALRHLAIAPETPLAMLFPGANFGSSKCWMPERFATVAAALAAPASYGLSVLLGGSPAEAPLIAAISAALPDDAAVRAGVHALTNIPNGVGLGAVKALVARSRLMVCNDTGPRHFAAAFSTPVVTLFGPTDPRWAETYAANERQVRVAVACSPCQLKRCPIDHRCMRSITPDVVLAQIKAVLG